ncbi:NAD(+)/NADH kinase [Sulfobacillus thermosulfidooxidans]|uniref:NAD(+)/NADH kinase n=1 Tax=Sulfobacillus thermosulfidooxidans TaxID=28034 RepID=UPI00096B6B79|nr:NAD(+)/NADH kinase [Sulfobacillus thermosulfidooxidans]OLZ11746.1 ATP-NAD kinase [Sulfobacillus thermosulfidooxidans]OLZ18709.1 ATP-NAD kinase [Sulfobacillus thermosulfidooxidans]OLZ20212.1 ATP-NAD kinase [Sulfobacillus thermosulfidooxidans]
MPTIGLIINPMAGRDIRRLVAAASLQSAPEKMLVVRRLFSGMSGIPDTEVMMIDDYEGFGRYALHELNDLLPVKLIAGEKEPSNGASTIDWAKRLEQAGARVIVSVGGDGTQRNIAQAHLRIPILPIAGGTNNVACWTGDQTAAGYACALYLARGDDPLDVGFQAKLIHVQLESGHEELALIDVALVRQAYTGALAVWHAEDVERLLLTVADPVRPGLSNVGGFLNPVFPGDDVALQVTLRGGPPGQATLAVMAPGLMTPFYVQQAEPLALGQTVTWSRKEGGSLALDGERSVVLRPQEPVMLRVIRDGPFVLDPTKILRRPS